MQICAKCNAQADDDAIFCSECGAPVQNAKQTIYSTPVTPVYDPYDHTAEFDKNDISTNKLYAMSVYLLDWIGIIITLLAAQKSEYAAFHVRQALKLTIVQTLLTLSALVTFFTFIVPIVATIMTIVLSVVKIISFVQVCNGKAKEPVIIRNLSFLR